MITAVDTSVLLDVFLDDAEFSMRSAAALRSCLREGALVACEVVWAELAGAFPESRQAEVALDRLGLGFVPMASASALRAGDLWREYRARGGRRRRVIADFLIGAHAVEHADRLLTRDRGFYSAYFEGLTLLDPAVGPNR